LRLSPRKKKKKRKLVIIKFIFDLGGEGREGKGDSKGKEGGGDSSLLLKGKKKGSTIQFPFSTRRGEGKREKKTGRRGDS